MHDVHRRAITVAPWARSSTPIVVVQGKSPRCNDPRNPGAMPAMLLASIHARPRMTLKVMAEDGWDPLTNTVNELAGDAWDRWNYIEHGTR